MSERPLHHFDDAMQLEPISDGRLRGRTTEPYANMVGPFGGVTAASMLRSIEMQPQMLGDPVAFTTNFISAVEPGEFEIAPKCVRTNRSTQHWLVEMTQGEHTVATATAVTAVHRETWSDTEVRPPQAPPAAEVDRLHGAPMAWPNQYDMRFVRGSLTGDDQPSDSSETVLWVRDHPARPLDFAALTALCDSFFPRIYVRLGRAIPIGTVSMTTYFHAGADEVAAQGSDHLLGAARGSRYDRGFFDQSAQLWGSNERLLATSHQIVYFKG